ncbi:hypothetical protein DYB34_011396, partial [Aphanomyces astaci]
CQGCAAQDQQRPHAAQSPFNTAQASSVGSTPNVSSTTTQPSTSLMQCIKHLLLQLLPQDTLRRLTQHLCAIMTNISSNFPTINRVLDQARSNASLVQKQAVQLDEGGRCIMSLEAEIDDLHHERRQLMTDLADSN